MSRKIKSARGELVDFDLLKIKEQMASAPPTADVRARQDFIDKRLRRRLKKARPVPPKIEPQEGDVQVDPKMPATEDLGETKKIDEVKEAPVKKTRQKARPKPKTTEE